MNRNKGFTLIELLVVIAIIGILASIAIPAFIGQRDKAKRAEVNVLAGDLRKDVLEYYWHTGVFPSNNAQAGVAEPGNVRGLYVENIEIRDGAILAELNIDYYKNEEGPDYILRPAVFINDPTAPVLWGYGMDLPPGYREAGAGTGESGRP